MVIKKGSEIKPVEFDNIPEELKDIPHWTMWKGETRGDRIEKVPYSPKQALRNGKEVRSEWSNKDVWLTFEEAENAYDTGSYDGIGFFTNEDNGIYVLDIDGTTESEQHDFLRFATYCEYSPSGNGIHVYMQGEKPKKHKKKNEDENMELFSLNGFVTVTGHATNDVDYVNEMDSHIDKLVADIFFEPEDAYQPSESTAPKKHDLSDGEVLKRMFDSKNGEKIKKLWDGDLTDYKDNHNGADMALCNHLAWWTDRDPDQMYRLFSQSMLWRGDDNSKRSSPEAYDKYIYEFGINEAISKTKSGYDPDGQSDKNYKMNLSDTEDIPYPYIIYKNELYKVGEKGSGENKVEIKTRISRDIPRIKARLEDIESDNTYYLLEFENIKKGTKKEIQVKSKSISITRDILELSQSGFSINSNNASEVVGFLDRYESHNDIPTKKAVERLGHIKGELVHPMRKDNHYIIENEEYDRITKAFHTKGSLDSYLNDVLHPLKENKIPMFLLISSLSSILLEEFEVEPPIIDLSGNTSHGKTVSVKTALSVWGDFDDMIIEWNATQVAIERNAYYLNSYPLVLDDTMKAEDDNKIRKVIYNHSSGQTKSRGTINGITAVKRFRNILISTGEKSAADIANQDGGAAARTITLQDVPFPENYNFNDHFRRLNKNYGHIGLEFIDKYYAEKEIYKEYFTNSMKYYTQQSDNPVIKRLARTFAAIHTGGKVLSDIKGVQLSSEEIQNIMDTVFQSMVRNNKNLDKPLQRLNESLDVLNGKRHQIHRIAGQENRQGFIAYVKKDYIGIDPSFLDDVMGRVERLKVVSDWKERGYLICDKNRNAKRISVVLANPTNSMMTTTDNPSVIAIKREIFESQGFSFDEDEDMREKSVVRNGEVIDFKNR